jgi:hypothetical protein
MTGDLLQHALVTLTALLAMVVIIRRIAGFVGVRAKQTPCACPSSKGSCGSTQPVSSAAPQPLPLMAKPPASSPRARLLG